MEIVINTIDLKLQFENIHHVEIADVSCSEEEYITLLNIWNTEEYKSLSQQIVILNKLDVIKKYKLSNNLKWNCIYNLNDGFYLLGSKFSSLYSGAVLSLFKDNTIVFSKMFDKGYATEINSIQINKQDSFLIKGNWFRCIPCGGHDDYFPEQWQSRITIENSVFTDEDLDNSYQNSRPTHVPDSELNSENYYVLEDFGISKYNKDDSLIWNQGLGSVGKENLIPINKIATYYRFQNNLSLADGVWFSGMNFTNSENTFGEVLFGRVTAGGTILSFAHVLDDFPEINKIHQIVSGKDINCLLIGETLHAGKGSGLFLLLIHFSDGICNTTIKYLNFNTNDFELSVSDYPWFQERYLQVKGIYPNSSSLEDLNEIIILGNTDHLRNRDNGQIWSIKINNVFNTGFK